MVSEPGSVRSRQLLVLAVLAALLATAWAVRTSPGPNSDRYDYLGRAHHLLEGKGARPLVVYPLRFAFDGADAWPIENLTRPPLWPMAVAPALRWGGGDASGVIVAGLGLLTLLPLIWMASDRVIGEGTGGFAALAMATSFATVRALWGGGPEIWITLLLFVAWTWNATAAGRWGWLGLGAVLGSMPWLHPIGWMYAAIGLVSRVGRTSPRGLAIAALTALVVGLPWYVQVGRVTGQPFSPLQSHAELAKSVRDPGGLGPYRTLTGVTSREVIRSDPGQWLYQSAWNLKEQALHLDGWLPWPLVALALLGVRRDPRLGARDAMIGALAFAVVANVARDPRLLVPLLPIACVWAGAGFREVLDRRPGWAGPVAASLLVGLPWLLPLGASLRPAEELRHLDPHVRNPTLESVRRVSMAPNPGTPLVVDNAVLAWRSRRVAVLIPDSPATLHDLLRRPALRDASSLVLLSGIENPWFSSAPDAWSSWLAERDRDERAIPVLVALDARPASTSVEIYVPEPMQLTINDVPVDLVELDAPPASREGLRLRSSAAASLYRMVEAARQDGVSLRVISAYRSYVRQSQLFDAAVSRHGANQKWVAAPGSSEHQLATTVDFADAAMKAVLEPEFAETEEGRWLAAHAAEFGWIRSYTEENAEMTGYEPEPWHYRHRPALFEGESDSSRGTEN